MSETTTNHTPSRPRLQKPVDFSSYPPISFRYHNIILYFKNFHAAYESTFGRTRSFSFNRWSCRRPDDFIPPVPVRKRRKAEYCCIFCENCRYGPFFIASSVENRKIQNALLQILSDWDTIFKKTTETVENSVKKPHPRPIPPSVLHSLSPGFKASPLLK